MLTRFEKRQQTARQMAQTLLKLYGGDAESIHDRLLSYCNGQRWLARLVEREIDYLAPVVEDPGRRAVKRKVLEERQQKRLRYSRRAA